MTYPSLDPTDLRTALEEAGLRCTPQRLAVYEELTTAPRHPTAEELFQAVRSRLPRISLATVYKALEALVEVGAATRLNAGTGAGSGSARYDARGDDHYHFRCLRSGTVHDLPTQFVPDLIDRLDPHLADDLRRRGFRVTGYRLELLGYQEEGRTSSREPDGGVRDGAPSADLEGLFRDEGARES